MPRVLSSGVWIAATGCPPISWWTGNDTPDDSADSNNGTLVNGAGYMAGQVADAFSLARASSQSVFIGNPLNLKLATSITLMAWVKPVSLPDPYFGFNEPYAIITKWGQSAFTDSYGIWLIQPRFGSSNIVLLGAIGVSGVSTGGFGGGTIPLDTWTFVAMTYSKASGQGILYVNGVSIATFTSAGINTSDLNVMLGQEDSVYPRNFDGGIDEARIFGCALPAATILSIYNAEKTL